MSKKSRATFAETFWETFVKCSHDLSYSYTRGRLSWPAFWPTFGRTIKQWLIDSLMITVEVFIFICITMQW